MGDPGVSGWYVKQPRTGKQNEICCVNCGRLDGDAGHLRPCTGCNVVHFCRPCCRQAAKKGHAVACSIGYGRACVAARGLTQDQHITFGYFNTVRSDELSERSLQWERESPF